MDRFNSATLVAMRTMIVLGAMVLAAATAHSQWTLENSNSTASLRGIHSLGGGIAWASGTEGTVLRTEDGGFEWQTCSIPPGAEKLDFRGIQAFDANTAIVMSSGKGDLSRLYKTTDGCHSWKLIFTNPDKDGFWDAYRVEADDGSGKNGTNGILIGDPVNGRFPIWTVSKDESAFQVLPVKHLPASGQNEAAFAASNSSVFVQWTYGTFWIATGGKDYARVIQRKQHLSDEFTWHSYPSAKTPIAHGSQSSGIFGLSFRPEGPRWVHDALAYVSGIAVGGDYLKPDDSSDTAAFTNDGGKTWQSATQLPHGYRSAVAYNTVTKTWITVGPNGTDISTDDGRNWRVVKPNAALNEPADADKNWNALSLPFVVGPHGRIGKLNEPAIKAALATK
jgi:photosystem II stability/assembly factor-like uncharacterized protein